MPEGSDRLRLLRILTLLLFHLDAVAYKRRLLAFVNRRVGAAYHLRPFLKLNALAFHHDSPVIRTVPTEDRHVPVCHITERVLAVSVRAHIGIDRHITGR